MAKIGFENVSKTFPGGVEAIRDFTCEIPDGELAVLVGPSGCGKSTLIRMVAGLETITRGEIRIGGRVVNELLPERRNAAVVFQNYALYPHMTVRQNLGFPLKMRRLGRNEIEEKVREAARMLDIEALLERKPKQLSGGQRQRVAMGRAIVRDPDVFLMDEPLSNLDARLRTQIRSEIAALHRRLGATTLYVTHDQVEAMTLGQTVCMLKEGILKQSAPPKVIYESPADVFVAGFFGSPGMNILPAELELTGDRLLSIRIGDQQIALNTRSDPPVDLTDRNPLLLGFRPEALEARDDAASPESLSLTVDAVELLGHEQLVQAYTDATMSTELKEVLSNEGIDPTRIVARLPLDIHTAAGERIRLGFRSTELHLFEREGAMRLVGSIQA